ncbi:MAG TPA: DUF397 domain-containing protein [Streptosporangiaceae bacterium]|nr:DUF397 domain-containing protein [Streptosporangiaceae bacterium]
MRISAAVSADLDWHVSRTCDSGQCVRVARAGQTVLIGNTARPEGPFSEFTLDEWRHFLAGAKQGDFDEVAGPPPVRPDVPDHPGLR